MATKRLTAVITKEGKWYVAKSLEVEVASQGETIEDALANLKEALQLYFEDEHPMPSFQPPVIVPLEIEVDV